MQSKACHHYRIAAKVRTRSGINGFVFGMRRNFTAITELIAHQIHLTRLIINVFRQIFDPKILLEAPFASTHSIIVMVYCERVY